MSDPYGYGVSNPTEEPITFSGEIPLPETVSVNDPGLSTLKANADHSHLLEIGGVTNPWKSVLFAGGWYNYSASNSRLCEYSSIGGVGFLRGVFGNAGVSIPSTMGSIPLAFCSRTGFRETFPAYCSVGACEIDLLPNGQIQLQSGPIGTVGWVVIGTLMWSMD